MLNKIHPGRGVYEDGVLEIEKLKVELSWKLNEQKMKMRFENECLNRYSFARTLYLLYHMLLLRCEERIFFIV